MHTNYGYIPPKLWLHNTEAIMATPDLPGLDTSRLPWAKSAGGSLDDGGNGHVA